MTGNAPIGNAHDSFLTFVNQSGKPFTMRVGALVRAEVMEVIEAGLVALKIIPPAGRGEAAQGRTIRAQSEVPLAKGENILLQYLGGDKDAKMRFLGAEGGQGASRAEGLAARMLELLSGLSGARLGSSDLRLLAGAFRAVPEGIKASYPEFRVIERLMPGIEQLTAALLKSSVEGSGVLMEARLRAASQGPPEAGEAEGGAAAPSRLLESLRDPAVMRLLQQAGLSEEEIQSMGNSPPASGRPSLEAPAEEGTLFRLLLSLKESAVTKALLQTGLEEGEVSALKTSVENEVMKGMRTPGLRDVFVKLIASLGRQGLEEALKSAGIEGGEITALKEMLSQGGEALRPETGEALLRLLANLQTTESASLAGKAGLREGKVGEEITALLKEALGRADSLFQAPALREALQKLADALRDPAVFEALKGAGLGEEEISALGAHARGQAETQAGPAARDLPERTPGQGMAEDLKGALLKIKETLGDPAAAGGLREAGLKPSELADAADKFLRHIELFQLTSKANEMLYTFMPLSWEELNDGEFQFRRQGGDEDESYTCDINLDLDPLGRLSVSVTSYAGAFYVTFTAERPEARDLIASEKGGLEDGFKAQGLRLVAVNVSRKGEVSFGGEASRGVNLKV